MLVAVLSLKLEILKSFVQCTLIYSHERHGPRQVRGRQYAGKAELNVQFEMAPFCEKNRRASKDSEVASAAAFVHQALFPSIRIDLLPKSSIDAHIMVLDADTSILGCCALATMAASAAVAQAGVQMYGLVVGTAAVRIFYLRESLLRLLYLQTITRFSSSGLLNPQRAKVLMRAQSCCSVACLLSMSQRAMSCRVQCTAWTL